MKEELEEVIRNFFIRKGYKIRRVNLQNSVGNLDEKDVIDGSQLLNIRITKNENLQKL